MGNEGGRLMLIIMSADDEESVADWLSFGWRGAAGWLRT